MAFSAIYDACVLYPFQVRDALMVADIKEIFPFATIPLADYESLIPVMTNHPKDRHILAAAVSRGVNVIVTIDFIDFPPAALEPYMIDAHSPDVFVRHVIDLEPGLFVKCFRERNDARRSWATRTGKQPRSDEDIARQLAFTNPPMQDTSAHLLECLANPRYRP